MWKGLVAELVDGDVVPRWIELGWVELGWVELGRGLGERFHAGEARQVFEKGRGVIRDPAFGRREGREKSDLHLG